MQLNVGSAIWGRYNIKTNGAPRDFIIFNFLRTPRGVFGPLPPGGGANLTTLTHLGGGSDPPSI